MESQNNVNTFPDYFLSTFLFILMSFNTFHVHSPITPKKICYVIANVLCHRY